ncbi:MAG TPA: NfeD family protein [Nevskiaceae bacterium]|nr:NfeD family protein [Nevskiaceae bacterium]
MIGEFLWWHWLLIGFVLLILEMVLPTEFVLLWMGVSAIMVGALSGLVAVPWQLQCVLFGVLSMVSYFGYRKLRPRIDSDKPTLNRRGHSYVGRNFTLTVPIVNGIGKLHVDDSQWRIAGPDLPAGSQVKVVDVDGTTLKVEASH